MCLICICTIQELIFVFKSSEFGSDVIFESTLGNQLYHDIRKLYISARWRWNDLIYGRISSYLHHTYIHLNVYETRHLSKIYPIGGAILKMLQKVNFFKCKTKFQILTPLNTKIRTKIEQSSNQWTISYLTFAKTINISETFKQYALKE